MCGRVGRPPRGASAPAARGGVIEGGVEKEKERERVRETERVGMRAVLQGERHEERGIAIKSERERER